MKNTNKEQYIINPEEWNYGCYFDESTANNGFMVRIEQGNDIWGNKGYKLLASIGGAFGDGDIYFYDLSQTEYTQSPYVDCATQYEFDDDGNPLENIVVPQWFIDRCELYSRLEEEAESAMADFMDSIGKSTDEPFDYADEQKALEWFEANGKTKHDLNDSIYAYNSYR